MHGISTVAKQLIRKREMEIDTLKQARKIREKNNVPVLRVQLAQRRQQLAQMRERKDFLVEDNLALRDEIIRIEAGGLKSVQNMLLTCQRYVASKQTMTSHFHRDNAELSERRRVEAAATDAEIKKLFDALERLDLEATQDMVMLQQLIQYEEQGQFQDERLKDRLRVKLSMLQETVLAEREETLALIESNRRLYHEMHETDLDKVLSDTTDMAIRAMDTDTKCAALSNVDVKAEIEVTRGWITTLQERIRSLLAENNLLQKEVSEAARALGRRKTARATAFLPSGSLPDKARDDCITAKLDAISTDLSIMTGYSVSKRYPGGYEPSRSKDKH